MAAILVCGGGVCGLITAMLLADDGHDVTVLERDAAPPPPAEDAWDEWDRRGVNQFRLAHFLMPRFRYEMVRHLPRVVDELAAVGAFEFNFFGPFREAVADPERFDVITARRPVLESVVAKVAASTPRLTIHRGVAIAGLLTGAGDGGGPHVVGVRTEDGREHRADLVVAATGRRSPLGRWIVEAGGRPPIEQEEDSGFVYYGNYLRTSDGSQACQAPGLADFGSIGAITLPADNGTVGVGIIASSGDAALRKLRHEEPWRKVAQRLPALEPLLDLEPISEFVAMAGIEDRYRRFVVDGAPVATGVLAVADAWAATNPTLGRGISLGVMHALRLRDLVRQGHASPREQALDWDRVTETELRPWYDSTVWHDRFKVAMYAHAAGVGPKVDDPKWQRFATLGKIAFGDLDLGVRWAERSGYLLEPPDRLLDDPELVAKLDADPVDLQEHEGPSREELLELVGA